MKVVRKEDTLVPSGGRISIDIEYINSGCTGASSHKHRVNSSISVEDQNYTLISNLSTSKSKVQPASNTKTRHLNHPNTSMSLISSKAISHIYSRYFVASHFSNHLLSTLNFHHSHSPLPSHFHFQHQVPPNSRSLDTVSISNATLPVPYHIRRISQPNKGQQQWPIPQTVLISYDIRRDTQHGISSHTFPIGV
jgi:hypothetical protein